MAMKRICPDYYAAFRCKQGACRRACCTLWPITVSLREYYRLLGMECSGEMRRLIDMALAPLPRPTDEEYACLSPRFDGECRLRAPDGRCRIHMEMGESALPEVCRLYPRGIRNDVFPSAACACSCEAVVEMLMKRPEPIKFVCADDDIQVSEGDKAGGEAALNAAQGLLESIYVLQDRAVSLPDRIRRLGQKMGVGLCSEPFIEIKHCDSARLISAALSLLAGASRAGGSVKEYGLKAQKRLFGEKNNLFQPEEALSRLAASSKQLNAARPYMPFTLEHLIVNHMFFTRFGLNRLPREDSWLSLSGIYIVLRLLCLGNPECIESDAVLADLFASAFRLMSHTDSERLIALFIKQNGIERDVYALMQI